MGRDNGLWGVGGTRIPPIYMVTDTPDIHERVTNPVSLSLLFMRPDGKYFYW